MARRKRLPGCFRKAFSGCFKGSVKSKFEIPKYIALRAQSCTALRLSGLFCIPIPFRG
jgi:hypothetical protein